MFNLIQNTENYHVHISSVSFYTLQSWLTQVTFENTFQNISCFDMIYYEFIYYKCKKVIDAQQCDTLLTLTLGKDLRN